MGPSLSGDTCGRGSGLRGHSRLSCVSALAAVKRLPVALLPLRHLMGAPESFTTETLRTLSKRENKPKKTPYSLCLCGATVHLPRHR